MIGMTSSGKDMVLFGMYVVYQAAVRITAASVRYQQRSAWVVGRLRSGDTRLFVADGLGEVSTLLIQARIARAGPSV